METIKIVIITIIIWQSINFVVGLLVEKFSRSDILETVLTWMNTFIILAPLKFFTKLLKAFTKK